MAYQNIKVHLMDTPDNQVLNNQNVYDNCASLFVSMDRETLGTVKHVSHQIQFFGYQKSDLKGTNIQKLMPSFIAKGHQKLITDHLNYKEGYDSTSKYNIIHKYREVFVKVKKGFMLHSNLYIAPVPYLRHVFMYACYIRPIKNAEDYMMVSLDGTIEGITEKICRNLKISPPSEHQRPHLREVCVQYEFFQKALQLLRKVDMKKVRGQLFSSWRGQLSADNLEFLDQFTNGGFGLDYKITPNLNEGGHNNDQTVETAYYNTIVQEKYYNSQPYFILRLQQTEYKKQYTKIDFTEEETLLNDTMNTQPKAHHGREKQQIDFDESLSFQNVDEKVQVNTAAKPRQCHGVELQLSESDSNSDDVLPSLTSVAQKSFFKKFSIQTSAYSSPSQLRDKKRNFTTGSKQGAPPILPKISLTNVNESITKKFDKENPSETNLNKLGKEVRYISNQLKDLDFKDKVHNRDEGMTPINNNNFKTSDSDKKNAVILEHSSALGSLGYGEESFVNGSLDTDSNPVGVGQMLRAVGSLSETQSVASVTNAKESVNSRIEEAAYNTNTEISLKVLNFSVIGHILFSIIVIVFYIFEGERQINKLPNIMEVSTHNFWSHYWLTIGFYWNTNIMQLWLQNISRSRFDVEYGPPYYHWILGFYKNEGVKHTNFSNRIRQSIHLFEPKQQEQFYTPLNVYERLDDSKTTKMSFFELSAQLSNAVWRLATWENQPQFLTLDDYDIRFIMNNTIDDMLIQTENNYRIVQADIKDKLGQLQRILTFLIAGIISIGLFVFGTSVRNEVKFVSKKQSFIEAFCHIRDEEIDYILPSVSHFRECIDSTDDANKMVLKMNKKFLLDKRKVEKTIKSRRIKARAVNTQGLNQKSYLGLIFVFLFQSTLLGVCVGIYVIFKNGETNISTQVDRAVRNNILFGKFGTCFLTMYQYVGEDGWFTLRNKPIEEEWNRDYEDISNSVKFFSELRDTTNQTFLTKLDDVLKGDLCQILYKGDCNHVKEESKNGLLGLNAIIIEAVRNIKDTYDQSQKTFHDKQQVMLIDSSFDIEWLYWLFAPPAYQILEQLLKDNVIIAIDQFEKANIMVIIIFSVCFTLLIRIAWIPILRNFKKERLLVKKMFRSIPTHIAIGNSFIKNYLILNSDDILVSVKQSLAN